MYRYLWGPNNFDYVWYAWIKPCRIPFTSLLDYGYLFKKKQQTTTTTTTTTNKTISFCQLIICASFRFQVLFPFIFILTRTLFVSLPKWAIMSYMISLNLNIIRIVNSIFFTLFIRSVSWFIYVRKFFLSDHNKTAWHNRSIYKSLCVIAVLWSTSKSVSQQKGLCSCH
jgi:hypothetical protein